MKQLKKIALIIGMFIGILYGFFHLPKIMIAKNVTIKTRYMFYACGDCYTQYLVIDITPNAAFLKGKDIHVRAEKNNELIDFDSSLNIEKCWTCYHYTCTGTLYYEIQSGEYTLVTETYKVHFNRECCYGN